MIKQKKKILVTLIATFAIVVGVIFAFSLKNNYKPIDDSIVPVPQNLSLDSYMDGTIYVEWDALYNVSGYEVWYSVSGSEFEILKTCSISAQHGYTFTGLDNFSTYSFKVRAFVENGGRNYSNFSQTLSMVAIAGNSARAEYVAPEPVHVHSWASATCTTPQTCSCGATNGVANGHNFGNNSQTCLVCGASNPNYVAPHTHSWASATCTTPQTCSCGATNGVANGHNFGNNSQTCLVCGVSNPNYIAQVPIPAPKVDEPVLNLTGYLTGDTTLALVWNIENCTDFTKYKLFLSVNDGNWNQVRTITETNTTETTSSNLNSNTIYRYKIVAYNGDKEIVSSNIATIITPARQNTPTQSTSTQPNSTLDTKTVDDYVIDAFNNTNALRRSLGLQELTLDPTLCEMAQYRVEDMGNEGYFSHYKNGVAQIRVVRQMFNYKCSNMGENICFTTYTDDIGNRCYNSWIQSESHYDNLTKSYWTKTGIAFYQAPNGSWYAAQIFAY